jgi:hypothetical protein
MKLLEFSYGLCDVMKYPAVPVYELVRPLKSKILISDI